MNSLEEINTEVRSENLDYKQLIFLQINRIGLAQTMRQECGDNKVFNEAVRSLLLLVYPYLDIDKFKEIMGKKRHNIIIRTKRGNTITSEKTIPLKLIDFRISEFNGMESYWCSVYAFIMQELHRLGMLKEDKGEETV